MEELLIVAVAACAAGIVQGTTGFGAGIVLMLVVPFFLPLPQSAGVVCAICVAVSTSMVIRYHGKVVLRQALPPTVLYIAVCTVAISLSTLADPAIMKRIFGAFLLVLAAYYLFFAKSGKPGRVGVPLGIVYIVVSALCDSFFSIGGPLMVLYFMSRTDDFEEYLGTIQAFFLTNSVYNTAFRAIRGIIVPDFLPLIAVGVVFILVGAFVASRIVGRVNTDILRKATYLMIAVCGIVNLW